MISTHPLYTADHDYYRRSERGLQMKIGSSSSLSEHCTSSNSSQRQSPVLELEQKASTSQRKRVPVACDRCRKRKIKCSGDEGGGQGCQNCRNAGWEGCQFLRVHSFTTPVNSAAVDHGRSWQAAGRFHPYSYHGQRSTSHTHPACPSALPPYSLWTAPTEYAPCQSPSQTPIFSRRSYASQFPLPFSSEPGYPYANGTPPSYMLPDPEPAQPTNSTYMSSLPRPQMWLENAPHMSVVQNGGQLANTFGVGFSEGQSSYTAMMQSNSNVSPTERLLPTFHNSRMMPSVSITTTDTPPMSAVSHRSSVGWLAETASNASATSSQTSCSGQQDAPTSFGNSNCATQDLTYSYNHVPGSTQSTATTPVLQVTNDDHQLNRSMHMCGPSQPQRGFRNFSYESTESSCSNSPSFSYAYNETSLQGHRNNSGTSSRHMPMVSSCMWNNTKELRGNAGNDDCQRDTPDN